MIRDTPRGKRFPVGQKATPDREVRGARSAGHALAPLGVADREGILPHLEVDALVAPGEEPATIGGEQREVRDDRQILVLDHGEIVARGTHEQLLETSETYQEIVASQLSVEEVA